MRPGRTPPNPAPPSTFVYAFLGAFAGSIAAVSQGWLAQLSWKALLVLLVSCALFAGIFLAIAKIVGDLLDRNTEQRWADSLTPAERDQRPAPTDTPPTSP